MATESSGTPESNGGPSQAGDSAVAQALRWTPAAWPRDLSARRRLEEYVDEMRAGLQVEPIRLVEFKGTEIDLRGAVLDGAPWSGAWLNGALLDGVTLRGASLTDAQLAGASMIAADLADARLEEADLSHVAARGVILAGADLRDAILLDADLRDAILAGASLARTLLAGTDLRGADLSDARLQPWTLVRSARLHGARFSDAQGVLRGSGIVSEDMSASPLQGSELTDWFSSHGWSVRAEEPTAPR